MPSSISNGKPPADEPIYHIVTLGRTEAHQLEGPATHSDRLAADAAHAQLRIDGHHRRRDFKPSCTLPADEGKRGTGINLSVQRSAADLSYQKIVGFA